MRKFYIGAAAFVAGIAVQATPLLAVPPLQCLTDKENAVGDALSERPAAVLYVRENLRAMSEIARDFCTLRESAQQGEEIDFDAVVPTRLPPVINQVTMANNIAFYAGLVALTKRVQQDIKRNPKHHIAKR